MPSDDTQGPTTVIPGRYESIELWCAMHTGESRDSGFSALRAAPEWRCKNLPHAPGCSDTL